MASDLSAIRSPTQCDGRDPADQAFSCRAWITERIFELSHLCFFYNVSLENGAPAKPAFCESSALKICPNYSRLQVSAPVPQENGDAIHRASVWSLCTEWFSLVPPPRPPKHVRTSPGAMRRGLFVVQYRRRTHSCARLVDTS